MMGRIYPLAALLVFADVIMQASCVEKGSLTFVIDDTLSMTDDINQVKNSVNRIMDIVFNEKASVISNMVLVTFNDPDARVREVTDKRSKFNRALKAVYAHNNNVNYDCREPSMNGLILALNKVNRGSHMYVFTDASANDYQKAHIVKNLCQKKQTQISFVITGRCTKYYPDKRMSVYYKIAQACSGLAYEVNKTEVSQVLRPITDIISGEKVIITSTTVEAGVLKDISFDVDDQTEYVIVSVSGKDVYLKISGPAGKQENLMWNANGKVVKLLNVQAGKYTATVKGQSKTSVIIVGRSDFLFKHGFSELMPKSLKDTSLQPIANTNVYLSVLVTDTRQAVEITKAQILGMDEKPISPDLRLAKISQDYYVTPHFVTPTQRFKVAVFGRVKATGRIIKRIAKIPITPQEPPIKLPDRRVPKAVISEGKETSVEYNSTLKLTCRVTAFPKPKISWYNKKGKLMPSKSSTIEYPYDYISLMEMPVTQEDTYMCRAVNNAGSGNALIKVNVKEAITPVNLAPSMEMEYGKPGTLKCGMTSRLPMEIHWYYMDESSGIKKQVTNSNKYSVSADKTTLTIKKVELDSVGKYVCRGYLKNDRKIQKESTQRVQVTGLVPPKIQTQPNVQAVKGKSAILECKVSGVPTPTIKWQFRGKSDSAFVTLGETGNVLRITNAGAAHEGQYKCVAENALATDEKVITLDVQETPKIVVSSSSPDTYGAIEGDATLKLPCVAYGDPKPSISWKMDGRLIAVPSSKYVIEDGALVIRNPTVADSKSYMCVATNEAGSETATFKTFIRQKPQVTGVATKKVNLGMPVDIECKIVKGWPKPSIRWFVNNSGSKFVPVTETGDVMHIAKAENKHTGRYKCVVQNKAGTAEHITSLTVEFPPKIQTQPNVQAVKGKSAILECKVSGVPTPTIKWQFRGKSDSAFVTLGETGNVLRITNAGAAHEGQYKCVAENALAKDEKVITLDVQETPKIVVSSSSPDTYEAIEGDATLKLPCVANGDPKPSISWKMDGRLIAVPSSKYVIEDGALVIRNPTVADSKSYVCVATNEAGSETATFKTFIRQKPQVTGVATKKVNLGMPVDIECKIVKGWPKPSIRWFVNNSGSKFVPVTETGDVMHIAKAENKHTGRYKCVVQNKAGTAEHITSLTVEFPPKIQTQPNVQAVKGKSAILECKVSGVPTPTIKWQFRGKSDSAFVTLGETGNVLRITNAGAAHEGQYKCVAENALAKDEKVITLDVQETPKIVVSSSSPDTYEAIEGDATLKLPCVANGDPKPSISWKMDGRLIAVPSSKYVIEDGALVIRNPTVADSKLYVCVATNEAGSETATFKTFIRQKPQVTGVATKKVNLGMPVDIECKIVKGWPKPSIRWFVNNSGSKFVPVTETGDVMHIAKAENKHTGRYKCVVQNKAGTAEHITSLTVEFPPKIQTQPNVQAVKGKSAILECKVSGVPTPTIKWQFRGKSDSAFVTLGETGNVLRITNAGAAHEGQYKCVAQNALAKDEKVFTLDVQETPKIAVSSSSPDTYEAIEGDATLKISCVANGDPKPSISWKMDGRLIAVPSSKYVIEDGALVIRNPTVADSKSYVCVATNEAGSETATFKTFIRQKPQVTGVANKKVNLGMPVDIECKIVKGWPKPSIRWFVNNSGSKFVPVTETGDVMHIAKAENKHTGRYKCVVQNKAGTAEHITSLTVEFPPKIQTQPNVQAVKGKSAILECKVSGVPTPTIKWQFRGKSDSAFVTLGETGNVLRITNAGAAHEGQYKCVAENALAKDEKVITLDVQETPKIQVSSSSPDTYEAIEGDATLKLPCVANGDPKPSISWKMDGRLIAVPSSKYVIEDGALVIRNPTVADSKSYVCVATNEAGSETATFKTFIRQKPQVTGVATKKVNLGMPVDIECKIIKGWPKPSIRWFVNNSGSKFVPVTETGDVMHIAKAENKHTGRYKCVVQNKAGTAEHITSLTVEFPPKIQTQPNVQAVKGKSAILECKVSGVPTPTIKWQFRGKSDSAFVTLGETGNVLRITNAGATHEGQYKCVAENALAKDEKVITLDVQETPKIQVSSSSPDTYEAIEGDATLKLPCVANGDPKPSISWKMDGRLIAVPSSKYVIEDGALVIRNPTVADSKSYVCVATNEAGSETETFKTFIRQKPQVTGVATKKVSVGIPVDIECKIVKGWPKPRIRWFVNNSGSKFVPVTETGDVMHIAKAENKHTGRYKCVVQNKAGTAEHITSLTVEFPPKIQTQPNVQAVKGKSAILECKVSGVPTPTIIWQFRGKSDSAFVTLGETGNVLRITNAGAAHEGQYKCVAENALAKDEKVITLDVQETPKIVVSSSSPDTYEAIEGDATLKLPCVANGDPKPSISWKIDGRLIAVPSSKYVIEDGALVIRNPTVADSKSYVCVATNEAGSETATFKTFIRQKPQVTGVATKKVNLGMPVDIECKIVKGWPKPSIRWFVNNSGSKFVPVTETGDVMHIAKAENKHTGRYKCVVQNKAGTAEHITSLTVEFPPKIQTQPNVQAVKGKSAILECKVSGVPTPTIKWQFRGKSDSAFVTLGETGNVLRITNAGAAHEGQYKCVAENALAKDEKVITLDVQETPKIVVSSSSPDTYEAIEGDATLKLPCVANGDPKPSISWKMDGRLIAVPSSKYVIEDGALVIRNPTVADSKSYVCVATNEAGSETATFKTFIRQKPQVTGVATKKVNLGMPVDIECKIVKGWPKPSIRWFVNNSGSKFIPVTETGDVMHIAKAENKHTGRYKCVVQNKAGTAEHITSLTVEFPPKIQTQPNVQAVKGKSAILECKVSGVPTPTIKWQFRGKSDSAFVTLGETGNVLRITNAGAAHEGQYKCVAENALAKDEKVITLDVQETQKIVVSSSSPDTYEAIEGDAILKLPCVANGDPKPSISWKMDGRLIAVPSSKYVIEDGALVIRNPTVADSKSYVCVATNEAGSETATFKTFIRQKPQVTGVATKKVNLGMPVDIECKIVKGWPKPSIRWFVNNSGSKFVPVTETGDVMHIAKAENKHTGRYKCVVQNKAGTAEHITSLTVEFPPKIQTQPNVQAVKGKSAILECKVSGVPTPTIKWQFRGKSDSAFVTLGETGNVLRITNAGAAHEGQYKCVAENALAKDEKVITLDVQAPPEIVTKSKSVEAIEGDLAIKIPCDVTGVPRPAITWKLNGAVITSNAKYSFDNGSLVIQNPNKKDVGKYICEAKNHLGSVSTTIVLTLEKRPSTFGTTHFVYILYGEDKKIGCEAYRSKSQSLKWFDNEGELHKEFIEVTKASVSNDGNYTCHVSDKQGHTETHTYIVNVGFPPKLLADNPLDDWRGEVQDIRSNCDSDAKPQAQVQWKYNGNVIPDSDVKDLGITYKWGHYTCNVSNPHGSVLRDFDVKSSACLIPKNLKDAEYMPLLLNDKGDWPTWETSKYFSVVEPEQQLTLSCPKRNDAPNSFKKFSTKTELKAYCFKEDVFVVDGEMHKLSDLQCTQGIRPTVAKKNVKCLTDNSELIKVGYDVGGFLESYEVCFDNAVHMPRYIRNIVTSSTDRLSPTYVWHTYPGIDNSKNEKAFTCKDKLSSCCYAKSQLVEAKDFTYDAEMNTTFIDPLNVVPVWRPCSASQTSWESINKMVREQTPYDEFVVWSGTDTLQVKNGVVIPRYLWKVIRFDDDEIIAIVHVNDRTPTDADIKCKNVCNRDDEPWFKVSDKYTYCCSLPDFLKAFNYHNTNIGALNDDAE